MITFPCISGAIPSFVHSDEEHWAFPGRVLYAGFGGDNETSRLCWRVFHPDWPQAQNSHGNRALLIGPDLQIPNPSSQQFTNQNVVCLGVAGGLSTPWIGGECLGSVPRPAVAKWSFSRPGLNSHEWVPFHLQPGSAPNPTRSLCISTNLTGMVALYEVE